MKQSLSQTETNNKLTAVNKKNRFRYFFYAHKLAWITVREIERYLNVISLNKCNFKLIIWISYNKLNSHYKMFSVDIEMLEAITVD